MLYMPISKKCFSYHSLWSTFFIGTAPIIRTCISCHTYKNPMANVAITNSVAIGCLPTLALATGCTVCRQLPVISFVATGCTVCRQPPVISFVALSPKLKYPGYNGWPDYRARSRLEGVHSIDLPILSSCSSDSIEVFSLIK